MERFGFRKHLGCWKPHLRDSINNLFIARWGESLLFFLLSNMFMFGGEATKKSWVFLLLIWRVLFFSSHDKWCFGVGVRHIFSHSLDLESPGRPSYHWLFLFSDIFDWGIKFFWFILRISAGTNTYSTYIHTSIYTRYIALGKVFDKDVSEPQLEAAFELFIPFGFFSLLSIFETI